MTSGLSWSVVARLTIQMPDGVATVTGQGTAATDSNGNPSTTTVAAGGSDLTLDFGFYQPATIGQYVWFDANANGLQNAGETGLSNVVLTLSGTNGAGVAVSATTITDTLCTARRAFVALGAMQSLCGPKIRARLRGLRSRAPAPRRPLA